MRDVQIATKQKANPVLRIVGLLIGGGLVVILLLAALGSTLGRGSFNGENDTVYEAMSLYGASYSHQQADAGVDDIREQAEISESEAQRVAVQAVRAGLRPDKWGKFGYVSVKLAKLKRDGVID